MTTVLVYLQAAKLGGTHERIQARLRDRATDYGSPIRAVFRELGSPVRELMSMVAEVDTELGGGVLPRLHRVAAERGALLENLLSSPRPSPALWSLLDAVGHLESDGVVLVPSPQHFDGLGMARHVITGCLSARSVQIAYLDTAPAAGEVLAELELPALPLAYQITRLRLERGLLRGGLADYLDPVRETVEALLAEAVSEGFDDLARRVWLKVRRSPTSSALLIRFTDSYSHDSEIPQAVTASSATARRFRVAAGATVTVCEIAVIALDTETDTTLVPAPTPDRALQRRAASASTGENR